MITMRFCMKISIFTMICYIYIHMAYSFNCSINWTSTESAASRIGDDCLTCPRKKWCDKHRGCPCQCSLIKRDRRVCKLFHLNCNCMILKLDFSAKFFHDINHYKKISDQWNVMKSNLFIRQTSSNQGLQCSIFSSSYLYCSL